MKKFIVAISIIVILYFILDYVYYHLGWYIDFQPNRPVAASVTTQGKRIMVKDDNRLEPIVIRGVNMGSSVPGEWTTDYAIDKGTYLRWFEQIHDLGANTIRVYSIQNEAFYEALYEYNSASDEPLWLLQGIWVNDYAQNSHRDAYDEEFYGELTKMCRVTVDVVHGQRKLSLGTKASAASGSFTYDVSPWVLGFIVGSDWENTTVAYTNEKYGDDAEHTSYQGTYMYTDEGANAFEAMLARVGDSLLEYESARYKQQRLVAFFNWPMTDPFEYPRVVEEHFMKCAQVDVEHIKTTDAVLSGQFASYHVYFYFPDQLAYLNVQYGLDVYASVEPGFDAAGLDSYAAYVAMLAAHHDMPVVITEFGVSSGRGASECYVSGAELNGGVSEQRQGEIIVEAFSDIVNAGCAGGCVFTWQDEWVKRSWNTMYAVDLMRSPYWSDYQTNGQYYGLLSFDPGEEACVCYVDGDVAEWTEGDLVLVGDTGSLSMKYDEKFVYLMVHAQGFDLEGRQLYIPIDTTQKTGSSFCSNLGLLFDRAADFVLVIDGKENSRLLVQKRSESLGSTYSPQVYREDPYLAGNAPLPDGPAFVPIKMILQSSTQVLYGDRSSPALTYETGRLMYGNANPSSPDYDSLADFACSGDFIEVKIPWQLLNFADPSRMMVHDDYYDGNYGVEFIQIDAMYVGLGSDVGTWGRIEMRPFALSGWGNDVSYHERLKPSYYCLQACWSGYEENDEAA